MKMILHKKSWWIAKRNNRGESKLKVNEWLWKLIAQKWSGEKKQMKISN